MHSSQTPDCCHVGLNGALQYIRQELVVLYTCLTNLHFGHSNGLLVGIQYLYRSHDP